MLYYRIENVKGIVATLFGLSFFSDTTNRVSQEGHPEEGMNTFEGIRRRISIAGLCTWTILAVGAASFGVVLAGCGKSAPPIASEEDAKAEAKKAMDRMIQDQASRSPQGGALPGAPGAGGPPMG